MRLDLNSDAAVAVARRMCELDGWKLIISGSALSGLWCDSVKRYSRYLAVNPSRISASVADSEKKKKQCYVQP